MEKITRYADIELRRFGEEKESRTVTGMATVFNTPTDLGWYVESIDSKAFDGADMSDVVLNFNHNDDYILAGTRNGTLQLDLREDGLYQTGTIVKTTQGNDVLTLVEEGLINKMSFAFTVAEDEWTEQDGKDYRVITKIGKLYDVSLVTFPAYPQTFVGLRSKEDMDSRAKEHFLRKEQDERMAKLLDGKDFI